MTPPRLVSAAPADGDPRDDDALMLAARSGERAAFDLLVRRHQGKLIGFAYKFFGQSALAHDVAQDTFVDLLRAVPRYRAEGRFAPFLYRLALNRCRMTARARHYQDALRTKSDDLETAAGPAQERDRERERAVGRAMLRLTEKQRGVLLLRFWAGLLHHEIAEALGVRIGTVKSRLFGAVAALRKLLGEP